MLQRLRSRLNGEQGFTLIELLVVILIIGILAAIAIPSFLSQKGKATDANAKETARTAQTTIETYYTDHASYATDAAGLAAVEPSLAPLTATGATDTLTVGPATGAGTTGGTDNFKLSVTSDGGKRTFTITKASDGTVTRTCTLDASANGNAGGCVLSSGSTTSGTW